MIQEKQINKEVANAVIKGLSSIPKHLPSWLFYDPEGDKLFQKIMELPEYYLTNCEKEIIDKYKGTLLRHFSPLGEPFELIELGAGDGTKTEILLNHFVEKKANFVYAPVDVSKTVLAHLEKRIRKNLPNINIIPQNKRFHEALSGIKGPKGIKKIILFMGANIGNFSTDEALVFLRNLQRNMDCPDLLLIGFDLKKSPRLIQKAYDDDSGVTCAFNLNMLTRLNHELDANFDIDNFGHYPVYDPVDGSAKSYLISLKAQKVHLKALEMGFSFEEHETIQTEISQKYDLKLIVDMAKSAGLQIVDIFYDSQNFFCNVLYKKLN